MDIKVNNAPRKITLRRWRVMEIELKDGTCTRHVWGHDVEKNTGRASSDIVMFDRDDMIATTESGNSYTLMGLPGKSSLGRSAWNDWYHKSGAVKERDVTDEYLNVNKLSTGTFEKLQRMIQA